MTAMTARTARTAMTAETVGWFGPVLIQARSSSRSMSRSRLGNLDSHEFSCVRRGLSNPVYVRLCTSTGVSTKVKLHGVSGVYGM